MPQVPQVPFKHPSASNTFKCRSDLGVLQGPKVHKFLKCFKESSDEQNEWNISVSRSVRSEAYIYCLKIGTTVNTTCGKGSDKEETAANWFKNNIHDSFCFCTLAVIKVYFALIFSQNLLRFFFAFFRSE